MTDQEFETLFQQCPSFEDCMVAQLKEYKTLDDKLYQLIDEVADTLDRDGLNTFASLLDTLHLEEALQFRYYFSQGLQAGREIK